MMETDGTTQRLLLEPSIISAVLVVGLEAAADTISKVLYGRKVSEEKMTKEFTVEV